jgi:hypothetical protein
MKNKKLIVGFSITLLIAVCIFLIAYYNIISFYLEHSLKKTLSLEVTLDDKVIFEGNANPTRMMPPIIYDRILILGGKHTIQFYDKTRGIKEKETFSGSNVRTILIRTKKDILQDRHIIIDSKRIPIK